MSPQNRGKGDRPFRNPDPSEIRELRESHGLTVQEFAKRTGCTARRIVCWETEKGKTDHRRCDHLAWYAIKDILDNGFNR